MKIRFLVIPAMPLIVRILLFAVFAGTGLFFQLRLPDAVLPGFLVMAAGSLLLLARHYRNKPVDLGFEDWRPASKREFERIKNNLAMTKSIKYPFVFKPALGVLFIVLIGIAGFFALIEEEEELLILLADAAILLLPVSFSGQVKLWTPRELDLKMGRLAAVMDKGESSPHGFIITPYIRLDKDKEGKQIPEDIRLMIEPRRKPEDFIGVQVQVAINNGPNGAVPYMYVVFLCQGKGNTFRYLKEEKYGSMIKEPGGDEKYGYIVVRQRTGGGGYHTTDRDCLRLYRIAEEKLDTLQSKAARGG
ncbi:MAG: hypothetical protein JW881_18970 [Spirochaetales bacterium]|nr:hypothetical protein [Spirochaetales bacterium]